MSMRKGLTPIVASGTATMVKLLVATLACTSAYVGAEAAHTVFVRTPAASLSSTATPVRLVISARSVPMESASTEAPPREGTVTVTPTATGCGAEYRARSVVASTNGSAEYAWRLLRQSADSRTWRTYITAQAGFAGATRAVEWRPRIVANPGRYKVELKVAHDVYTSDSFDVPC